MSIPREAYQVLQSIVGLEWVSDDPAILEADRRGGGMGGAGTVAVRPACSIQPESYEEVQAIVKLANRYKLPFNATSTYFSPDLSPKRENAIFIDLKRMRRLEIDAENMYAVVEPGVSCAALQAEAFKRGLLAFVPGCGGQASVLANTLNAGDAPMCWRYGLGHRRMLAIEWVLPDGELVRLGSRSMSEDFFWGEGPGPDLRGLLRGGMGSSSPAMKGIFTKIGVKMLPFVSEKLVPQGVSPHTTLLLPENRFKWYNLVFPTKQKAIDAIYEMGKCEIGLTVMTVPPLFQSVARTRGTGCAGFWQSWRERGSSIDLNQCIVRILLYGIGSEKRLAYEEKVLLDIVDEFDGTARQARNRDETNFKAADANCAFVVGGRFYSILSNDSMDHNLKVGEIINKNVDKHKPPILEEYGTTNWIVPYELGHNAKQESLRMTSVEDESALMAMSRDCQKDFLEVGAIVGIEDTEIFGAAWGNYPEKMRGIKEVIDPNDVACA